MGKISVNQSVDRGWDTSTERRECILEALCHRRKDTISNLAREFKVTERTLMRDIEELTLAHPISTIRGRYGGGVKVADGYFVGRKYLKPSQQYLLMKMRDMVKGEDLAVLESIFKDFALKK